MVAGYVWIYIVAAMRFIHVLGLHFFSPNWNWSAEVQQVYQRQDSYEDFKSKFAIFKDLRILLPYNYFPNKTQQMNRIWNIVDDFRETKTMFAIQPSKFPWIHFQTNSRKHFTR